MQSERSLRKTRSVRRILKSASSAAVTFQSNVFDFEEAEADHLMMTSEQNFRVLECGT